jgi:hypothetical protein
VDTHCFVRFQANQTYHQQRVNSEEHKYPSTKGKAAALALLWGAVTLATSILLLEDGTDDDTDPDGDGKTAEDILSFV